MNTQRILTPAKSNAKTAKGADLGIEAMILHLSPADKSGYVTCSHCSPGCRAACLDTSGHGQFANTQRARITKTRRFFEDRPGFMTQLVREIANLEKRATRGGKTPAVRLNGTSDIGWTRIPCTRDGVTYRNVFEAFPGVQFYDYTKVPSRYMTALPDNYAVTFSLSETNDAHAVQALMRGLNLAVVLRLDKHEPMPDTWSGRPVIDGTLHDFRFLDPRGGYIIGLRPKGDAKHDTSGFVRDIDDVLDANKRVVLALAQAA